MILDLSEKFLSTKRFPDKAFDIIDQVGSRTKIKYATVPTNVSDVRNYIAKNNSLKQLFRRRAFIQKILSDGSEDRLISRKEYIRLIEQITTEENDWAHGEHTEPTTRPEDPAAASILAAERDRLGRQIYLTRWTNGEEKWGPRDTTDHDGPGDPRGGSGLRKRRTTKTPGPSHREPPARVFPG